MMIVFSSIIIIIIIIVVVVVIVILSSLLGLYSIMLQTRASPTVLYSATNIRKRVVTDSRHVRPSAAYCVLLASSLDAHPTGFGEWDC
jgi:hypothetical protein